MTELRRIVVGTAGHIDHGKTSLVEALTGTDCDRWEEEKRRGITIDLGFAARLETLDSGETLQIGFVDVPGHERFVHNALAGLGGIDLMMLVVAADEGVKPQTREHLAICELLQIPAGIVALTKVDLVDEELVELAELELREALEGTGFEAAPIVPVSSRTGDGVERLVRTLVERATMELTGKTARRERRGYPPRLPIDRSFQLQGLGALVTGTLHTGEIGLGDTLRIEPGAKEARVRSLQVHGEGRERAVAGERVSLQLVGVGAADVDRGQVALGGPAAVTRRLLVRFRLVEEAQNLELRRDRPLEIRLHVFSADRLGKLRPIADDESTRVPVARLENDSSADDGRLGEILLQEPVVAVRGDRFVMRRSSPRTTIGGGEVLDPLWRFERAHSAELAAAIATSTEDAILCWAQRRGAVGLQPDDIASRLGSTGSAATELLGRLAADGKLLRVEDAGSRPRWLLPRVLRETGERARRLLDEHFAQDHLSVGMPKASLLSALLPRGGAALGDPLLDLFEKQKLLTVEGDRVSVPGRGGLSKGESDLSVRIARAFAAQGLTPGSPPEICRQLDAKPQIFDGLLKHLVARGEMVRLPDGLFVSRSALDELARAVREEPWEAFTVPEFKQRFELTRKWAIPLLEYLDRQKVTRREGNSRRVLRLKN